MTLFCNVTGDPAPNVVWVDARNHVTNSGATLKLPKISRRLKGEYICVASNACGSGSKTTTIDVQCELELAHLLFAIIHWILHRLGCDFNFILTPVLVVSVFLVFSQCKFNPCHVNAKRKDLS